MAEHDELFTPEQVNEQVERLSQAPISAAPNAQVVRNLQRMYERDAEKDSQSLKRAWQRIAASSQHIQQQERSTRLTPMQKPTQTRTPLGNTPPVRSAILKQRFATIAAVVFLALLVGSMAAVFNAAQHGKRGGTGGIGGATNTPVHQSHATPTSTSPARSSTIGTTVYTYHQAGIYSIAWSPDSKRIASSGDQVKVWDATTGGNVFTYTPHVGGHVFNVGWSPDGKRIATTTTAVEVWDATTGQVTVTYSPTAQQGMVPGSFTRNALVSNNGSGTNKTFLTTQAPQQMLSGGGQLYALAWSPDGTSIASASSDNTMDHSLQVWNASTGVLRARYVGHTDTIFDLAWSPNGKFLASASRDGTVRVWNVATSQLIYTYRGHHTSVGTVAWAPDSTRIASADLNGVVHIWDATTGTHDVTYKQAATNGVSLAWSPNGKQIVSAGGQDVQIWDAATGTHVFTYRGHHVKVSLSSGVSGAVWSPDGKYIASSDVSDTFNGTVNVWLAS